MTCALLELLRRLQRATRPERWRAWTAFELELLPVRDIADQEGRPVNTIHNLVRLARRDFAAALRRDASVPHGLRPFQRIRKPPRWRKLRG